MIIHKPSRSVLLRSRNPQLIRSTIRKSKDVALQGHNVAVYHGVEEVQVLRNLDIAVPSPVYEHYLWPSRYPFIMGHQKETTAFCTYHRRAYVFNEQGTGKTASLMWLTDFLRSEGLSQRTLIVCTLSTMKLVWANAVFELFPEKTSLILHGDRATRFKRLAQPVDYYVINHDGLEIIEAALVQRPDIDTLILDEASVYRTPGTNKWKALNRIINKHRLDMRVYMLTGTPCPNEPTDAWALAKLMSPSSVPDFRGTFKRRVMLQKGPFKWTPRPEGWKLAYDVMQPAIRFKKADCIDLPPVVTEMREVELTDMQKRAFKEMRSQMQMEWSDSILGGEKISAVHAADQVLKLRQILCGAVKVPGEDGLYAPLDHAPRLTALLECIEQASAKVFVVVPFKGIIKLLAEELAAHKVTCEVINGDVSPKERNNIITRFKTMQDPRVLLCHPKVISHGINLVEADTMVFYAPIVSADEYLQSMDRFNRPGQTRKMTIIKLGAHKLEWKMYENLDNRRSGQESMLEMYRQLIED